MPDRILLVELTGATDVGATAVYRFATYPYATAPTDTPANTPYDECVEQAGLIEQQLFEAGQSGARANPRGSVGAGNIKLLDLDFSLEPIFGAASGISFRERTVRVLSVAPGAAYATAQVLLVATIGQVRREGDYRVVSIKDRLYELASPHLTARYGGTNVLPAGVDGGPELVGRIKPRAMGRVFAVPPVCVNTSRLIYQVSDGPVQSITPYDGALAITLGADYASQADMEANAPALGQARVWPAGGMFRLQAKAVFELVADVTADTAANSTAAQILQRLALARGWAPGDINAADVTALDTANNAVCGIWVDDDTATTDLMDPIARSVGASYWVSPTGSLRMARFTGTLGAPGTQVVLAPWNVERLELVDSDEDVPTLEVVVKYAKYYRTQGAGQVQTSATAATVADVAQPWRLARYSAAISPNPHKRTRTAERETLLTTKAAADAEALRLWGITSVRRRTFWARGVDLSPAELARVELNGEVELRWRGHGLDETVGTVFRVIAEITDQSAGVVDLLIWGN